MPAIPDNRLKGNYGAAVVMTRLSGQCLVRPVAGDTDVGVDLYCETVANGRPFLHFWVQVKTGEQSKVDPSTNNALCSFDCDHLDYWSQQPVPVFAALVPTAWPVRDDPDVYIVDITSHLLFAGVPEDRASVTLRSDYYWPAGDLDCIRAFLAQAVPDTTARLQCSKGVVAASPTPTLEYVQRTPAVPVLRYRTQILDQVRRTAANSILFAIPDEERAADATAFRRLLSRILELFDDDPHWENTMARALSSHVDRDFAAALILYERAKSSILGDHNIHDEPSWQERVHMIERLKKRARNQELPGRIY